MKKQDFTTTTQTDKKTKLKQEDQIRTEDIELTLEEEPKQVEEKITFEVRTFNQLDKILDKETSERFRGIVEKTKSKSIEYKKHKKAIKKSKGDSRNSSALIIFGMILLLLTIGLVVLSVNTLEKTDGSTEGCLTSIASAILLIILASLLGIFGFVLLIIGLVVLIKD